MEASLEIKTEEEEGGESRGRFPQHKRKIKLCLTHGHGGFRAVKERQVVYPVSDHSAQDAPQLYCSRF